MSTEADGPCGSALSEGLGPNAMMPAWLLPLHEAVLIANTHRTRIEVVQDVAHAVHQNQAEEIYKLRALLRRALPMADALDATKTAVVWTGDMQCNASMLARDICAALGPNVVLSGARTGLDGA